MTITLDLPDDLASRLNILLPEERHRPFLVSALEEAISALEQEGETQLAMSLLADIDPENEAERETTECLTTVEEELAGLEKGEILVDFEALRRQWANETEALNSPTKS